nr:biopolymer transporter ExbD [Candidatus Eremiobacteraeota bacterium]
VMAEINITPFTDVLLVLLIIFMILAALITPPGFEKALDPHSPPTSSKPNPHNQIEVDVTAKGVIYVDGKKSDVAHIYVDMAAVAARKPGKHVEIVPDVKAPYGLIIRILDAAKIANLTDVGFATS